MKSSGVVSTVFIMSLIAGCEDPGSSSAGKLDLNTETDSVSYSLGLSVAQNVKTQGLENINPEAVAKAFHDVFADSETLLTEDEANQFLDLYFNKASMAKAEEQKQAGIEYLEKNKTNEGIIILPSGLQYEIINQGDGEKPGPNDRVTTHYHGTTIDGEVFDSSVERDEPATFPVGGVIKGWQEALQLMAVGSKWRLFVPSDLAYGARGAGPKIGPHAALIFEVELLSIER